MKDRLNAIIEQKGLTATKFATLIDANPSAISHLLKGRNKPGYDLLVNIARAFPDISMDWLLTGKGNMYEDSASGTPVRTSAVSSDSPKEEKKTVKVETVAEPAPLPPEVAAFIPPAAPRKELKRIILFFADGSFEDYSR